MYLIIRKLLIFITIISLSNNSIAQNEIIREKDIPKLNSIIKSLEKEYNRSVSTNEIKAYSNQIYSFKSLLQATGSYFEIRTKTPDEFLSSLAKSENLQQLKKSYPNLQVDQDLLIVKSNNINYKKEKILALSSFQTGNSNNHVIELIFSDSLNKEDIKHFHSIYPFAKEKITTIRGFYLNERFKSIPIPNKYTDWVYYKDIMVKPQTSIYFNQEKYSNEDQNYNKTIIDSLVGYYNTKTNIPTYTKEKDFNSYREELSIWQSKRKFYGDSLLKNDRKFKRLLHKSLIYAEKNKVSNGDLEYFTSQFISKERALNLMRQNQKIGTCSFDNTPLIQLKGIAELAAQTQNWDVFIKSFLNIMNDNVSRIANSNIASEGRKTYIQELTQLDIDIQKLLIGSNFRFTDTTNKHYFSDNSKIAKAFSILSPSYQQAFEKTISEIISDQSIDPFNRFHFYNTFLNYKYSLKDSVKRAQVNNTINNLIPSLPDVIRSRIENPNKELYDLLYNETADLDLFEIQRLSIGDIYSYSYGGDCWRAKLIDKGSSTRISYNLTMPIEEEITPLKNFLDKKAELTSRVKNHPFLQKILNLTPENSISINFTKDQSFSNYRNIVTNDMPEELKTKLDFNDAISLTFIFSKTESVNFILFKNGNVLILDIPEKFSFAGYSFEELITKKIELLPTHFIYKSFKIFNDQGEILN